jgi:Tfp pilus assembly PilM family ATPase
MIRALAVQDPEPAEEPGGARADAVLYCNVGDAMNLAVARGMACLFTRVSNVGLGGIVTRLGTEAGLSGDHATQWLRHVGLERPLDQIEGDPELIATCRRVLEEGLSGLVDELRLSLDYYGAQESAVPVSRVTLCGPGSSIEGLAGRMEEQLGLPIGAARPAALSGHDEAAAARLTLPFGLALDG